MLKRIFFTLALALFAFQLYAEVYIDPADRLKNRSDTPGNPAHGYCSWTCLEMLGRHNKVEALKDLVEKRMKEPVRHKLITPDGVEHTARRNEGEDAITKHKLQQLGVKFYCQPFKNKSTVLIEYAVKNNYGCMVSFRAGAFDGMDQNAHATLIVDFGTKEIKLLDPNEPNAISTRSRAWFNHYFSGWTYVILPEKYVELK